MNLVIFAVVVHCFVILAINSVSGRPGRELVTIVCSFRTGSGGSFNGLSPQDFKDLIFRGRSADGLNGLSPQDFKDIFRSGSAGGLDGLSPHDLEDLSSWSSSPGIFDGLSAQQLRDLICSGDREAGDLKHQIKRTPFMFGYNQQDVLQMDISFKLPSDVTGGIVSLRNSLKDYRPKSTFQIRRPHDETADPVVHVRDVLWDERVYIDVQLFNKTGIRLNKRISEGRVVKKSLNSSHTDYTYSPICLNGNQCQIKVNLRKECEDATISEKPSFNYILYISLSIFAIALCVLLIVVFTKLCWIKRDMPEIFQEPIQPWNPFYVNLLFRKECQEIIDDLEQNHYELID